MSTLPMDTSGILNMRFILSWCWHWK